MKTQNILFATLALIFIFLQSCSDDLVRINGSGSVVSETLSIETFSKVEIHGVDNVHISFGTEQKVEVEGHANIIDRIETKMVDGIWFMELEDGNYGHYELTYYLTLPFIESIKNNGTGDIYIDDMITQDEVKVVLNGTGNFYGYLLEVNNCQVDIIGTGNAEVNVKDNLDASIEGSGSIYYKGNPHIQNSVSGSGKLINAN